MKQIYLGGGRLIFEGEQAYTADETKKLQDLFKYMKENKVQCKEMYAGSTPYNLCNRTIPMALRFLYAFKFEHPKVVNAMKEYYQWYNTQVPKTLTPDIISGLVLLHVHTRTPASCESLAATAPTDPFSSSSPNMPLAT